MAGVIQRTENDGFDYGTPVYSESTGHKGEVRGTRSCGMEGCTGVRLIVQWEDGKRTHPCSKGMFYEQGRWVLPKVE